MNGTSNPTTAIMSSPSDSSRRYHLHECPGIEARHLKLPRGGHLGHSKHFWICFNPSCPSGYIYLCGLIVDVMASMKGGLKQNR